MPTISLSGYSGASLAAGRDSQAKKTTLTVSGDAHVLLVRCEGRAALQPPASLHATLQAKMQPSQGDSINDTDTAIASCSSLDEQSAKAAADVGKAHELVVLLLPRGGGLAGLAAALRVVGRPARHSKIGVQASTGKAAQAWQSAAAWTPHHSCSTCDCTEQECRAPASPHSSNKQCPVLPNSLTSRMHLGWVGCPGARRR